MYKFYLRSFENTKRKYYAHMGFLYIHYVESKIIFCSPHILRKISPVFKEGSYYYQLTINLYYLKIFFQSRDILSKQRFSFKANIFFQSKDIRSKIFKRYVLTFVVMWLSSNKVFRKRVHTIIHH